MEWFEDSSSQEFKLGLDKVFRGEVESIALKVPTDEPAEIGIHHRIDTRRTMEAKKMLIYFHKDMMKLKTLFYESNKKGYSFPVYEIVFCIRFYPTLGIMKYIKTFRKKNQPHLWNNCVYSRTLWNKFSAMPVVQRYLKYFDYPHKDAWKNIIPTFGGFGFSDMDKLKRCWRQPTAKAILREAGLPATKGMVRTLNKRIVQAQDDAVDNGYDNPAPMLQYALTMWKLTREINITREVLRDDVYLDDNIDIRTARKLFIRKGDKKSAMRFGRQLMERRWNSYVGDSIRLYKDIIKKTGGVPVLKGHNIKQIHDTLAYLSAQIKDKQHNIPVEYNDRADVINGHEFNVGDRLMRLELPYCPNDLVTYGNKLKHCVGGLGYRNACGEGKTLFVCVVDVETNRLMYVVSVEKQNVQQFKGYTNCYPSKLEYKTVIDLLFEYELISKSKFNDWENPSLHGRLEDRARKLNLDVAETPDVVASYDNDDCTVITDADIFDPLFGLPPLPVADGHEAPGEDAADEYIRTGEDGNGNVAFARPDIVQEHHMDDTVPF